MTRNFDNAVIRKVMMVVKMKCAQNEYSKNVMNSDTEMCMNWLKIKIKMS